MEAEKLESLLIDYIDGGLTETERQEVEALLSSDPEARKLHGQLKTVMDAMNSTGEIEPGRKLQADFERSLRMEMAASKQTPFRPVFYRAAAAIGLLILGAAIGFLVKHNMDRDEKIAALQRQIDETKQLMIAKLNDSQSASTRMMGATVAFKMDKADDQIVRALADALNKDPNTNVRLAALEALSHFRSESPVRQVLVASLATQRDPVIQIALIRLMVEMKEKQAVDQLKRLSNDEEAIPAVKDEAHAGLLKLS